MGQYIFSSELRRAAERVFAQAHVSLRVMVIGERPVEAMLFRNIASSIENVDPDDAAAALGLHDFALCGFDDLEALEKGLSAHDDSDRATGAIKGIAIRGPIGAVSAITWRRVEFLCARLGLILATQRTEIVDFARDKAVVMVLVRAADMGVDEPLALLKLAIFLEAHSLFDGAAELLARHNATAADATQAVEVAAIDCLYEIEAFADYATAAPAAAPRLEDDERAAEEGSVGPGPGRLLSVHFDQMHRVDGEARLRNLVRSLALPDQVEIVVRIAASQVPEAWPTLVAELAELGMAVSSFHDSAKPGAVNPSASGFLAETAPEALVAVYYGDIEPDVSGWDFDLLRVAKTVTAKMFALRISGHKTRNYFSRRDAEIAPEALPGVSRAWLEACGAWSAADVPASIFQTLVAFYYDRTDWTNKHRLLNLYPVMTLSPRRANAETETGSPNALRHRVPYRAQRRAIEMALKIHALEWGAGQGIDQPALKRDPIRNRLVMRGPARRQILKSWTLPQDRARLPL